MSEELPENMGKKVGPLPLGVWVLAVAGGVGVAVYVRRKAQAAPVVVDTTPNDTGALGGPAGTTAPTAGNLGATSSATSSTSSNPYSSDLNTPGPTTNDEWARLAIERLILKGYNPFMVDTAIRDYIGGSPVDATGQAAVNAALALIGPPPQTLPPTYGQGPATTNPAPITPAPHPSTPAPHPVVSAHPVTKPTPRTVAPRPAPRRSYRVVKGDNLTSIGHKFGRSWQQLYAANQHTIGANPNHIIPGQVLVIP